MGTNFLSSFSDNTKVWVYQSPRAFTSDEQAWLEQEADRFVASWNAHGAKIKATVQLLHDRFLIIASDQEYTANSGCSIDSMVGFVRAVQNKTGIDLMDRMLVYYENNGEYVPFHFQQLKDLVQQGVISVDTVVLNPLVDNKPAFEKGWKAPLKESWLSRFAS